MSFGSASLIFLASNKARGAPRLPRSRRLRRLASGRIQRDEQRNVSSRFAAERSTSLTRHAGVAVELSPRGGLLLAHASGHYLRAGVALRSHRHASHTAEHRELPDVGERVGKRTLDQLFD